MWARVNDCDPVQWSDAARKHGVLVSLGQWFDFRERNIPYLRLGFAACDEEELRRGVSALEKALRMVAPRRDRRGIDATA